MVDKMVDKERHAEIHDLIFNPRAHSGFINPVRKGTQEDFDELVEYVQIAIVRNGEMRFANVHVKELV